MHEINPQSFLALHPSLLLLVPDCPWSLELGRGGLFLSSSKCQKSQSSSLAFILQYLFPVLSLLLVPFFFSFWMDICTGYCLYLNLQKVELKLLTSSGGVCFGCFFLFLFISYPSFPPCLMRGIKTPSLGTATRRSQIVSAPVLAVQAGSPWLGMSRGTWPLLEAQWCSPSPLSLTQRTSTPSWTRLR